MFVETGLGAEFWAEEVFIVVYIINRLLNFLIKFEILEVRWILGDVDYLYLRSFGCVVYVYIISDKISLRALKGIFFGYGQGIKGFRIWFLEDQKVVISKDVVFYEECLYKDVNVLVDSEVSKVDNKGKRKVIFSENLEQFEKDQNDLIREIFDYGGASLLGEGFLGVKDLKGDDSDAELTGNQNTEDELVVN